MAILELKDVCFSYGDKKEEKQVLTSINGSFEQGKVYAVIGKSGSGKSTLISLMAGLTTPTSGEVCFEGQSTGSLDLEEYRRTCAALIFQDFMLFPLLTVQENIMYPMELCKVGKEEAFSQSRLLAQKVFLPEELLHKYPERISGGEKQRVAIARALAMDRRLLLADEPTGNLDEENTKGVVELLKKLAHEENRCVIIVTHDLEVMEEADEVYHMKKGHLERSQRFSR